MSERAGPRVPWPLWPFYLIWKLATALLVATGRLLCAVIGVVLLIAGVTIALTILGAPLGIPIALLGVLLVLRALF